MNNEDRDRYFNMIENNDNVSKTTDGKEFLILVSGIIGLCICLFLFADFFVGLYLNNMSVESQIKLEKTLSMAAVSGENKNLNGKYSKQLAVLNNIKKDIKRLDNRLIGKSEFNIYVDPSSEVNAFVIPDGSIYFTEGLLNEVKDEDVLAFVLAHEIGHYVHRDHLKSFGREIIAGTVFAIATSGQNGNLNTLVNNVHAISHIVYSQSQERNADLYANKTVLKLYGTNDGAIKFMSMIDEKQKLPQFIYYFSSHPSPKDRILLLKNDAQKYKRGL